MKFSSPTKLKDWIKKKAVEKNTTPELMIRSFMMERFLERISVSPYQENFILKGGFLIASMVGVDQRMTQDMDTTIKGMSVNNETIEKIIKEIIESDVDDNINFEVLSIKNIRDDSLYDDFRISLRGWLFKLRADIKVDITIGDSVIPTEISYPYRLLFEDRTVPIMAYNLDTILSEKMDSILSRNVSNTRSRDFYDVYLLVNLYRSTIDRMSFQQALKIKMKERNNEDSLKIHAILIEKIEDSDNLTTDWKNYGSKYPYAKNISFESVVQEIIWLLEGLNIDEN